MRLLRLLRLYLWFLTMLRLLGLLPWYLGDFAIAFAALSVTFAFRKRISLSGRPQVVPLVEDDHNVWNDLLQLFVHHTIAPLLVPALDDSSELSLALSCHFTSDVFTVMQHGLPGELVDVELSLRSISRSFFVGDRVNLAALSKAVNVSHEFLAGYVFEHGLGQLVTEIQAAAAAIAFEGDQLATQAVAASEA